MKHLFIIKEYILYKLKAKSAHGIHSPFVFDFILHILQDKRHFYAFEEIEQLRKELYSNNETVEVEDFGAGSHLQKTNFRIIKDIAKNAGRNEKYGKLLFKIIDHYKYINLLELGTSLGLGSSYMAKSNSDATLTTIEGSKNIAAIASQNFKSIQIENIEQKIGNFDANLEAICKQSTSPFDLIFVDGNHRKEPTINYYHILKKYISKSGMIIFDDIHWSEGMLEAWKEIKNDKQITMSIDLFYFGIVLFKDEFKEKQHFILKY
jgi:predicted O-methyltransferase YrrM